MRRIKWIGGAWLFTFGLAVALLIGGTGCGKGSTGAQKKINIDGSSTVEPISKAVAEAFTKQKEYKNVSISVGIAGTGGGFKKFYNGETDISDASRKIKKGEAEQCQKNGIEFIELKVAMDGLAVIINKDNTWATKMTVEQLKKIWHPETAAKKWSDVDPSWPKEEIKLFGADHASGTFDYFTEAINGEEDVIRKDYTPSADDNQIVSGVAGDKNALGFVGLAYARGAQDKLTMVAIKAEEGTKYVLPISDNVNDGTYAPLSRPLFIYVNKKSLKRTEVADFVKYYLTRSDLVSEVNYVELSEEDRAVAKMTLNNALKASGE